MDSISINNILIVSAHADDAELMAGGTMLKWFSEEKNIHVVTYTDGGLLLPDGTLYRDKEEAMKEELFVSEYIGYKRTNLGLQNLHLQFTDVNVIPLLNIIQEEKIDTIICPHNRDVHHDHEMASRLALAASRRVPNFLMGQINYFKGDFFTPNIFVDITKTWDKKIEALKLYKSQWREDWYEFLDATSIYYGKMIGVKRAEGFFTNKMLIK